MHLSSKASPHYQSILSDFSLLPSRLPLCIACLLVGPLSPKPPGVGSRESGKLSWFRNSIFTNILSLTKTPPKASGNNPSTVSNLKMWRDLSIRSSPTFSSVGAPLQNGWCHNCCYWCAGDMEVLGCILHQQSTCKTRHPWVCTRSCTYSVVKFVEYYSVVK